MTDNDGPQVAVEKESAMAGASSMPARSRRALVADSPGLAPRMRTMGHGDVASKREEPVSSPRRGAAASMARRAGR